MFQRGQQITHIRVPGVFGVVEISDEFFCQLRYCFVIDHHHLTHTKIIYTKVNINQLGNQWRAI